MISVLCVDDEQVLLDLYKLFLEQSGEIQVDTADSVRTAVGKLKKIRYDVIVSDYSMPEYDGVAFLKCILPTYGDIPFILFTGRGNEDTMIEALNNGARFYIQKGGDPKEQFADLIQKIKQAVGLKKVEDALRNSEIRYRNLFETANDGIILLDADAGEIIDANPFLLNLIGSSLEEILGKHLWDIGIFKDVDLIKKAFLELQTKKNIRYEDLPLMTKNDQEIVVEFVSTVYTVNHADVIQCNIRDITDRKRAEETLQDFNKKLQQGIEEKTAILRENELRHRILFESSRDAIMTLEAPDWRFTSGNLATIAMFRAKDEAEFTSTAPWDISPEYQPDGRPSGEKAKEMIENAVKEGSHYFEWIHKRLNGEEFPATVLLTRFEWKGEKILQATVRDITEQKHSEDKLNALLEEKVLLLREIHHRVKNNLQIIISLLNLQSRYIEDEKISQAIKESQNRIRAMALVHEKLYLSEDISKINLDDYVKYLGNSLFQFYDMKGKRIILTTDIQDVPVDINTAIPVGLIINELISNSLKHAFPDGRKGEISIAIQRKDRTLTLIYKDDGVGIPEDFDWRTANSLGLRLVVSLVTQLFGTIELDRTAGTAFTIVVKEKE